MRCSIFAINAALFAVANSAWAETVFAVTAEDLDACRTLSEYAGLLAQMRDVGASREQLQEFFPEGISDEVRDDLVSIVFSTEAGDPGFAKKVTGALCILERLQQRDAR